MIFTDFENLKIQLKQHEGQQIGLMLFEDKFDSKYLHSGYLDTLKQLRKKCDIVVIDIVGFGMLLSSIHYNLQELYKPTITIEEYKSYFGDLADYILYQTPYDQLARLREPTDIGFYKKKVNQYCKIYPMQYSVNEKITKTFLMIFELYGFKEMPIHCSANMWKCGYRSFFYKHYLENNLNIDMEITEPPRDIDGLIPADSDTHSDPEYRELLISINNKIKSWTGSLVELKETLSNAEHISEIYLFNGPYSQHPVIEVLIDKNNTKARIVHLCTDISK